MRAWTHFSPLGPLILAVVAAHHERMDFAQLFATIFVGFELFALRAMR